VNRKLAAAIHEAAAARWDVTVAAPTYFHGQRDIRPAVLSVAADEVAPVVPLRAYLTDRVHLFLYGRRLRSLLGEGWDLVHCWEEPFVLAGAQAAAWTPARVPFVFRTAQSLSKVYPPPFRWTERFVVRRASGWICSGTTVAENLATRPGYSDRPSALIPLGVDLSMFRPERAAGAAICKQLGWEPDGPPVVGFLGRFVPEKGIDLLTRALDQVKTPWRALFVGGGPQEDALRAWATTHKDRVRICSDVRHDDVPAYVNAMSVLAAPSQTTRRWKEQFGRMLIEGFASGIPVLGSDSGEIPHVLAGVGVVIPEADVAAWAEAIGGLLESPGRRAELGALGLARAREQFDWSVIGRKSVAFFDSLLDRAAR
jgi:glycosyltransferase involved in cell wall biosynthesis